MVTVETLNGDYKHSSDNLEVANIEEKQDDCITLPRMFSQDDFQLHQMKLPHLKTFNSGNTCIESSQK